MVEYLSAMQVKMAAFVSTKTPLLLFVGDLLLDNNIVRATRHLELVRTFSGIVGYTTYTAYKVIHVLLPQYLGPVNYVVILPGRRPLRSAGTNRLAMPPVKLTTVANQPGFPGCRPTDMERSSRRRDFSRIVIHLPSAT